MGQGNPQEIVGIIIVGIAVLEVLDPLIAIRNVVQVIKKYLAGPKLYSQVPFGIQDVFNPHPKWNGRLDITVFNRLFPLARHAKHRKTGKKVRCPALRQSRK